MLRERTELVWHRQATKCFRSASDTNTYYPGTVGAPVLDRWSHSNMPSSCVNWFVSNPNDTRVSPDPHSLGQMFYDVQTTEISMNPACVEPWDIMGVLIERVSYTRSVSGVPELTTQDRLTGVALYGNPSSRLPPKPPARNPPVFWGKPPVYPKLAAVPSGTTARELREVRRIVRFNNAQVALYERRLEKYIAKAKRYDLKLQSWTTWYEKARRSFEKRNASYHRWKEQALKGKLRKLRLGKDVHPEEHDYVKLVLRSRDQTPLILGGRFKMSDDARISFWAFPPRPGGWSNQVVYEGAGPLIPVWRDYYPRTASSYISKGEEVNIAKTLGLGLEKRIWDLKLPFKDRVLDQLTDRARDRKVHIGNMIAESNQTFKMVCTIFAKIISYVRRFKKAVPGALKELPDALDLQTIASLRLQWQFGLKPLIEDFDTALKALASLGDPATSRFSAQRTIACTLAGDGLTFTGVAEYRVTALCNRRDTVHETMLQWGLMNLYETAWELTPWSFLVDWAIPVGDWIQSQTDPISARVLTCTESIRLTGSFYYDSSLGAPLIPPGYAGATIGEGSLEGFVKLRRISPDLLSEDSDMTLKSPFSWSHGFTGAALAVKSLLK